MLVPVEPVASLAVGAAVPLAHAAAVMTFADLLYSCVEVLLVAAGVCNECLVQVSYAIGISEPMGIYVNTYGSSKINFSDQQISKLVSEIFDMRPYFIEKRLKLRNPIYTETAAYGHMGREYEVVEKSFKLPNGDIIKRKVELFTWEKLDYVDEIKKRINI